ncbi:MAG TPA: hypothetical protein VGN23_05780 [Verrucomicrobiae bacterium]|jgi:hypothetical protein
MKEECRRYNLWSVAAFAAYALGLVAFKHFYSDQSPYRYWLILLPVAPIICLAALTVRSISVVDEMKRKIFTEAMAFSGVATGYTCFSYSFLRNMGTPEFHAEYAFYMVLIYYFIGLFFSWRRYK